MPAELAREPGVTLLLDGPREGQGHSGLEEKRNK